MLSTPVYFLAGYVRLDTASFFAEFRDAATFVSFSWCVSLILLLRMGGFVDVDEVPLVLRPWFRVHPGYLDDLTLVWSKVRGGDPLVGLTLEIVLDQDRWCLDFQGLTDYSEFVVGFVASSVGTLSITPRGLWGLTLNHHSKSFYQISKDTLSFITYSLYSRLVNI